MAWWVLRTTYDALKDRYDTLKAEYDAYRTKAEQDKQWLWNELVKCRQTQPITYPPPSAIGEIVSDDLNALFNVPHLFIADAKWKVVPIDDVDKFMRLNPVSDAQYISELHDCDDFSEETKVDLKRWVIGLAVFEVWLKSRPHSQVLVVDIEKKLWIYEGQDDKRTPCNVNDLLFVN